MQRLVKHGKAQRVAAAVGCPSCSFDDDEVVHDVRRSLLAWYDVHQRSLPWRHGSTQDGERASVAPRAHGDTDDTRAYAVLVSEVMLQQTQVATVVGYYERWMKRWPTVEALAAAPLEHVNEVWAGLGYYSRARRLHEAAVAVVSRHGGKMPRSAAQLRELPGVGPYTAAAVASIAFNEVTGLVDGNVIRVLARLRGITASPKADTTVRQLWALANRLVDPARPGDFNQAMMELGATVCLPKKPLCDACPVRTHCRARTLANSHAKPAPSIESKGKLGLGGDVAEEVCSQCKLDGDGAPPDIESFPFKEPKKKQTEESFVVVVPRRGDARYIKRRPAGGLLASMWEFPNVALPSDSKSDVAEGVTRAANELAESGVCDAGAAVRFQPRGLVHHVFSHRRHTYHVYELDVGSFGPDESQFSAGAVSGDKDCDTDAVSREGPSGRWVSVSEFDAAAVSTNMKKVLRACISASASGCIDKKRQTTLTAHLARQPSKGDKPVMPKEEKTGNRTSARERGTAQRSDTLASGARKRRADAEPVVYGTQVGAPSISKYFKRVE